MFRLVLSFVSVHCRFAAGCETGPTWPSSDAAIWEQWGGPGGYPPIASITSRIQSEAGSPQRFGHTRFDDDSFQSDTDCYIFNYGTRVVAVVSKDIVGFIEETDDETGEQEAL